MPLLESIQKQAFAGEVDQEEFEEEFEEEEIEEALDEEEEEEEEEVEEEELYEDVEEEVEEVELSGEEEEEVDVQEEHAEESVKKSAIDEVTSSNPIQPAVTEVSGPLLPATISPFLKSVSDLETVHRALTEFFLQLHSLNRSLDLITVELDAQSRKGASYPEQDKNERSRLQIICDSMGGKALRKHLETNLSELETNLSELEGFGLEVTEALRRTPKPAKLVLEAMGRFYMQGSKAYKNNTALVSFRRTCILLLEFYVLSGCTSEDSPVKEEAKVAALAWRSRLMDESIEAASVEDSLGLILFVACFGIPQEFGFKDLCLLLRQSNLKKKSHVLRSSSTIVEKIPSVIKELIREEMYVEAADLSCYFGLKDRFPPLPLLSSFVAKVMQVGKKEQHGHSSERLLKEANMRKLTSLKSVAECVEDHKLDSSELGSEPIYQKIAKIEEDIAKEEGKSSVISGKRKVEDAMASKKSSKFKKPFHSSSEASHNIPSQVNKDKSEQGGAAQPQFPDYRGVLNGTTAGPVANDSKGYPYGWSGTYYETSAGYNSLGMAYPARSDLLGMPAVAAQNLYQTPASSHGIGVKSSGHLYQFADTVIQNEFPYGNTGRK